MSDMEKLIKALIEVLGQHGGCNQCRCGCPTDNVLEQAAFRYNDQSSQTAANALSSSQQFNALLGAELLEQSRSSRITTTPQA